MIRISTFAMYRSGIDSISARQREVLEVQQKLASGKRINSPADDPIAAGKAALLRSESSQFTQFTQNQSHARSMLEMTEGALSSMVEAVQDVKDRLSEAGNGILTDANRQTLATDLTGVLERMVGIANSSDGNGSFLFSGSKTGTTPFTVNGSTVSYQGDSTAQAVEVSQDRFQQVKLPGDLAFMRMRSGNGTFVTGAAAANTGTGTIDTGTVVDPSQVTGGAYTVGFSVTGGTSTYTVTRGGTTVSSGTYTSPATLTFEGIQFGITGAPANGDTFTVGPSAPQSVFQGVADAVTSLLSTAASPATQARFRSTLSSVQAAMDNALGSLSQSRGEIGTRQAELDAYSSINDSRKLDFDSRISTLEDLDMAQGASSLAQHQATFQAALQSYSTVSKLSLFNYMS